MEVIKLFDIPKEVINDNERQRRVYSVDGISPTILGRSDACKIMEARQLGNCMVTGKRENPNQGRVYDQDGLSPTLSCMEGGNRQPMIVAMRGRNPENPNSRQAGLHTEQRLEPNLKGLCNTLTSVQKDNLVMESVVLGGLGEKKSNGGTQYYQQDRVYSMGDVAMCHPSQIPGGSYRYMDNNYRIRKLTPKECWRLMGFTDTDFMKAEMVNSNTQLYKQAGNSIVKDVLEAIFKEMM